MHSSFLRLSDKELVCCFEEINSANFEALLQNNSVKDYLSIHEKMPSKCHFIKET